MGKNSKKHKREYEKRIAESGAPPAHPTNVEIFAEYELIGGIIWRRVEKDTVVDKENKVDSTQ